MYCCSVNIVSFLMFVSWYHGGVEVQVVNIELYAETSHYRPQLYQSSWAEMSYRSSRLCPVEDMLFPESVRTSGFLTLDGTSPSFISA